MKNILILFGVVLLGWYGLSFIDMSSDKDISKEEQEFNNSGRAKAIETNSDLWKFIEVDGANFIIKYPDNVTLKNDGNIQLMIESEKIDDLEYPGFNKNKVLATANSLKKGEYGGEFDWPIIYSKKVRNLGEVNAQEFMVLSRFEVCDITIERKALFFVNGYRVIITVKGDKNSIVESMPDFFEKNEENCQDNPVWNFNRFDSFVNDLKLGKGSESAQEWYESFDKIMNTIEFKGSQIVGNKNLLQGKWTSVDDEKSLVEFTETEKIDYYDGEEIGRDKFQIYFSKADQTKDDNGSHLIVGNNGEKMEYTIVHVGVNDLELTYLAKGNTLRYTR